jgi:hypothetical protein
MAIESDNCLQLQAGPASGRLPPGRVECRALSRCIGMRRIGAFLIAVTFLASGRAETRRSRLVVAANGSVPPRRFLERQCGGDYGRAGGFAGSIRPTRRLRALRKQ